jgi:uncharacterized protein YoaH (UPF0181 family)
MVKAIDRPAQTAAVLQSGEAVAIVAQKLGQHALRVAVEAFL